MIPQDKILSEVMTFYQVNIFNKSRERKVCFPRQVAMSLLISFGGMTLDSIGQLFSKDHATVLYAKRQVEKLCRAYPELRQQVISIESKLE